jgi:signal transduction histidine kinase
MIPHWLSSPTQCLAVFPAAPRVFPALVIIVVLLVAAIIYLGNRYLRTVAALERLQSLHKQLQRERDQAQEELFRRLYEEREWNKEKIQFQAQLAEYEKYSTLAQLALGAAHEIDNPLLGIQSHLELELRTTKDPEQRWEIEQCIAGTKRISATLHGLVNCARPGPLVLSNLSLSRLVGDTLGFLQGQPMLRGKVVENQVPDDLPRIVVDSSQFSQVLMNLLLNAAEATPDGGHITISANKLTDVESIEIQVSDTGCGIARDILPHVFEPFFTTKRGKGTGLGLSISQAYVKKIQGEIRVDSVVGHGTTVTITLPVHREEAHGKREELEFVV